MPTNMTIFELLSLLAAASSLMTPLVASFITLRLVEYRIMRAEDEINELKAIHSEISKVNDRLARIETNIAMSNERKYL